MNADRKPLPRFWYFPRGEKAVVVMTGDDHGSGNPAGRFELLKQQDPASCSVVEWECVRGTAYVYTSGPLTDAQAASYEAQGFEVALHVNTGCTATWTASELQDIYDGEVASFSSTFPSVPAPTTNRTHCISWNDYASQPKVELDHGIRLDTNYYYYPPEWIQDRPGMFTGSGIPMRFADVDGSLIDVYQATTQMTDESGQTYPQTIDALLDKAVGAEGYYGAFTANIHTDRSGAPAHAIVDSAQQRGVPVVSARQLLTWLNGRDGSSFESLSWSGDSLSFDIAVGAGANGLQAMLPTLAGSGSLSELTKNGSAIAFERQTIKGIEYAVFPAAAASFRARYAGSPTNQPPTAVADSYATQQNTPLTVAAPGVLSNDSDPDAGDSLSAVKITDPQSGSVTLNANGSFTYTPAAGFTGTASFTYKASDGTAQSNAATVSITVQATSTPGLTDTTTADFQAGTLGTDLYVGEDGDGELLLAPTVGSEFGGSALPAGWTSDSWNAGTGSVTVGGGSLSIDGAWAGTNAFFAAGRSLEFSATFGAASFEHAGLGVDYNTSPNWAMFSTKNTATTLYARTNNGGQATETELSGVSLGQPHRFRDRLGHRRGRLLRRRPGGRPAQRDDHRADAPARLRLHEWRAGARPSTGCA